MIAAARQRDGFDRVRNTISALAAHGADDRWVVHMTLQLTIPGFARVLYRAHQR